MIELYRRRVWNDARTVNVMAQACLGDGKVVGPAIRFFIDPSTANPEDEEAEEEKKKKKVPLHKRFSQHSKDRRSKRRKMKEAAAEDLREEKRKSKGVIDEEGTFLAIDLLHDPQGFAEKLLSKLKRAKETFDVRMLMIRLISRLIKRHKLQVDAFYPYLQKYLQPHQEHITLLLLSAVEASHELVSPEMLEPIVKTLMRDFIVDYKPGPLIQLGINTLREMAMRCPLILDKDTLKQVTVFKGFQKDKGVVSAVRGLINLYRAINPALLDRRDRGKDGQMNLADRKPLEFGESKVFHHIPGIDDLEELEAEGGMSGSENSDGELQEWEGSEGLEKIESGEEVSGDEDDENDENDDDDDEEDGSEMEDEEEGADGDEILEDENDDDQDDESSGEAKMVLSRKAKRNRDANEDEAPELIRAAFPNQKLQQDKEQDEEQDEEQENGSAANDNNSQATSLREAALTRVLTEEELRRIKKAREIKEQQRRAAVESETNTVFVGIDPDRDVGEADLRGWSKRQRQSKEERIEKADAGKETWTSRWERERAEKDSGSRNVDKLKNKPFLMTKQSARVRAKLSLSMQDKLVLQKRAAMKRRGKKFRKNGLMSNQKLNRITKRK